MIRTFFAVAGGVVIGLAFGMTNVHREREVHQNDIATLKARIDELENGAARRLALARAAAEAKDFETALKELVTLSLHHPDAAQAPDAVALRASVEATVAHQRKEVEEAAQRERRRAAEEAERARQLEARKGIVAWTKAPRSLSKDDLEGTRIRSFYKELEELAPAPRDAFETEAAYRARVRAHYAGKTLGTFPMNALFAFTKGANELFYDAGKGAFRLWLHNNQTIDSKRISGGTYVGENGFGVKRDIQREIVEDWTISIQNFQRYDKSYWSGYGSVHMTALAMPSDKAREIADHLVVVYVTRLAEPYVKLEQSQTTPTLDLPYETKRRTRAIVVDLVEIWIVDGRNGRILARPSAQGAG